MSVIRVNKTKDYTIMSNQHFKEKDMSLKAKGLLSLMLSLPDNWDYSINGLVSICKENASSIKSTLKELKDFGYLEITKKMPNETKTGRIEYIYDIYEKPKQDTKKQEVENLYVENQCVENQLQLNTNNKYINKLNTNNNKVSKKETYNDIINEMLVDEEVKEAMMDFIKMRTMKKKPLTNRALKQRINQLISLSNNKEEQIKIIDNSINKCWDEFYELKFDKKVFDKDYNCKDNSSLDLDEILGG